MPLTKIDYSNTIIYKLCCKDLSITEVYIGNTTDFRKRKWAHNADCNKENRKNYNLKVYKFIRDNGGWNNWDMIEVERFEAIDGNDARKKERYWIEELKATLNTEIPGRTRKEWEEDNKEKIREYKKEWCNINKEIISQKAKEYRKNNKEILAVKDRIKYEKNKEVIIEKEKEKGKIKVICDCGCEINRSSIARHKQSKKHIELMFKINGTR